MRLVVEIQREGEDRVQGSALGPDEQPRQFSGWLELIAVLEAALLTGQQESNVGQGIAERSR